MKTRRSSRSFRYRDCDAFAEYLHERSLQGWHFKEFRFGLVFEQGEPADIYYTVEVFPKGTEMDTRPEQNTKEYAEYCEAAGWKLIDSSRKFCVFRRTKEDAVPIVEPEERFLNIRKAEFLLWLNGTVPVFLLTILYWFQLLTANFSRWIFNNAMLLILMFMMLSFTERLMEGINLLYWSVTRKKMLEAADMPVYGSGKHRLLITGLPLILFLISAVFLALRDDSFLPYVLPPVIITILFLLTAAGIAVRRPSRNDNWSFQMIAGLSIAFYFGIVMTAVVIGVGSGNKEVPENAEEFPLIQADYRDMDGEISRAISDHMEGALGSLSYFSVTYSRTKEFRLRNSRLRRSRDIYLVRRSAHPPEGFCSIGKFGEVSYRTKVRFAPSRDATFFTPQLLFRARSGGLITASALQTEAAQPEDDGSDSIWYTVYQSRHSWILDRLWKDEMPNPESPSEDRTEAWNAVCAVSSKRQNGIWNELVRYRDKILILSTEEKLEDHQIEIIREKFRLYGQMSRTD